MLPCVGALKDLLPGELFVKRPVALIGGGGTGAPEEGLIIVGPGLPVVVPVLGPLPEVEGEGGVLIIALIFNLSLLEEASFCKTLLFFNLTVPSPYFS